MWSCGLWRGIFKSQVLVDISRIACRIGWRFNRRRMFTARTSRAGLLISVYAFDRGTLQTTKIKSSERHFEIRSDKSGVESCYLPSYFLSGDHRVRFVVWAVFDTGFATLSFVTQTIYGFQWLPCYLFANILISRVTQRIGSSVCLLSSQNTPLLQFPVKINIAEMLLVEILEALVLLYVRWCCVESIETLGRNKNPADFYFLTTWRNWRLLKRFHECISLFWNAVFRVTTDMLLSPYNLLRMWQADEVNISYFNSCTVCGKYTSSQNRVQVTFL